MTDPEAKVMKHKDGRSLPSYNHQSAVDGRCGVTCAVKTEDRCDGELDLLELVDTAKENTGGSHENVMADSAFGGYQVFEKAEQERAEQFFVPDTRLAAGEKGEGDKGKFDGSRFEKREDGTVICPAGHPMVLKAERQEESHTVRIYAGTACEGCALRENCTTAKQRTLNVDSREPLREQMRGDRGQRDLHEAAGHRGSRAWGRSAQQGLAAAPASREGEGHSGVHAGTDWLESEQDRDAQADGAARSHIEEKCGRTLSGAWIIQEAWRNCGGFGRGA